MKQTKVETLASRQLGRTKQFWYGFFISRKKKWKERNKKMTTYRIGNWNNSRLVAIDCNDWNPVETKPDPIGVRYLLAV